MKVNKEKLKDGKVLNKLIDRFITSKSINDLEALFLCLIDSDIFIPIDPNMKKKDIEILNKLKKEDYVNKKAIEIRPDWLKGTGEDKVLLPIFSTEEEAPKEYKDSLTILHPEYSIKNSESLDGLHFASINENKLLWYSILEFINKTENNKA